MKRQSSPDKDMVGNYKCFIEGIDAEFIRSGGKGIVETAVEDTTLGRRSKAVEILKMFSWMLEAIKKVDPTWQPNGFSRRIDLKKFKSSYDALIDFENLL